MPESKPWEGEIRNRACGLLVENGALLMVELWLPHIEGTVWSPPGGAAQFGESLEEALVREYREETGLVVEPEYLKYINEVRYENIHAIEFYFVCQRISGQIALGNDPEYSRKNQVLRDLSFIPIENMDSHNILPGFLPKKLPQDWQQNSKQIDHLSIM